MKYLLSVYRDIGPTSLGADKQRYFYGKINLQTLSEARQARLEIHEVKTALEDQLKSTINLASQITQSIRSLKADLKSTRITNSLRDVLRETPNRDGVSEDISNLDEKFTNSSLSIEETLKIIKELHQTIDYFYGLYQKNYIKYGLLMALIMVGCLVCNEVMKLLVKVCLCVSREYNVCIDFLRYRTQARSDLRRRRGREAVEEVNGQDEISPSIGLTPTYRYRGIEQ